MGGKKFDKVWIEKKTTQTFWLISQAKKNINESVFKGATIFYFMQVAFLELINISILGIRLSQKIFSSDDKK